MSARLNLWLLNTANAAIFTVVSMLQPLVVLYCCELGASPFTVGLVVAARSVVPLFLAIPAGVLVEQCGARILIAVGACGVLFGSSILVLGTDIGSVILSQLILGLFELLVIVSGQTFAASLGERDQREASLGVYTVSTSIGQLIGPSIGEATTDLFGYDAAFLLAAAICLPAVFSALGLKELRFERPRGEHALNPRRVASLARSDGVKVGIVSSFGVIFAVGVQQVFHPVYLQNVGFSPTVIGLLISIRAVASMSVRGFIPAIVRAVGGRFRALVGAMVLSALGVAALPQLEAFFPLAVCSVLLGAGVGLSMPLSLLAVADSTDPGEMGLAMGFRLTGNRLAQLMNPLAFAVVGDRWGIRVAFYVSGGLLLLTAFGLIRWNPGLKLMFRM